MGKIIKNMFPYWKWILVICLLLVIQVNGDLALPEYTSKIIDIGIQSKGIEHILPQKITEDDYQNASLFMTSDEREVLASVYEKKEDSYTCIADEEKLATLDDELLVPILMSYEMKAMAAAKSDDTEERNFAVDMGSDQKMDVSSMIMMLQSGQMSDDMLLKMREPLESQMETVGSNMLLSMGRMFAAECDENAGMNMEDVQMQYMWQVGGKMLAIALVMMLCAIIACLVASRVGASIGRDLRLKTFGNVVKFSNAEMDQFSTASLITRSTNDIQQIQMVTTLLLRMVLMAPIMGIGGIIKVAQAKSGMEWVIALAVLLISGFVMVLVAVTMPKFKAMQKLVDRLNLVSREILTGLNVIRAFGREQKEEERFDEANKDLTQTQLFTNRVMTMMMPGMSIIMYIITLLIVWVGAGRIDKGYMQVGTLTAFITYTMMIVMSFLMLTMMSIMLPRAGVAADRIDEVIHTQISIKETETPKTPEESKGILRFDHVGFTYPGANEEVISDIDFVAEPGKTTAIIGSTGCGKSTLVNLIPRFYDVTSGSIQLDGVDIRDMQLSDLRDKIGFVPQKGVLFSGTIASNLRFGKTDASDEEIMEAAKIAQAEDFIEEKNKKYESEISQGGSNVSGGQKQRLAIARAIAKDPLIYVFDDSFSALDMKTDAALRSALAQKTQDATVIIVAQRISTIIHADTILVLDDGKIAGCGTHEQLLRDCEIYEQIARSQLSAKELGISESTDTSREEEA